jgi:hypothetical protein
MLLLALFPAAALGATQPWQGNGWPVTENCNDAAPGTTLWIWTGDSPTALTVNGVAQPGSWVQSGNGSWKFVSGWFDAEPDHDTTFVTYTGEAGTLTITHGCPPETFTPSPPPPTPTPPTPTPPTPTPPTPTPPTPTPTVTPTPPVVEINATAAPCRFEGDDTRLRFRVIAGLILLSQVDIFIDGNLIDRNDIEIIDGEAFVVVEPGLRAWTITEEDNPEVVLASGETLCPTCFAVATPTPTPTASPPPTAPTPTAPPASHTVPPTDAIGSSSGGSTGPAMLVILLVLATAVGVTFLVPRKR